MVAVVLTLSMCTLCGGAWAADLLFSDKPLSIKVRDVDIRDVLRIIAEEYDLNIVIGKGVEGRISRFSRAMGWAMSSRTISFEWMI
jgi:type II secretory pathway component GspD/PulD (secretin)